MPFYHLLVSNTAPASEYALVKLDLQPKELQKLYFKPWTSGQEVVVDGRIWRLEDILSIRIIETARSSAHELDTLRRDSLARLDRMNADGPPYIIGLGAGNSYEDIAECGTDVTKRFLPTGALSRRQSSELFHSPWIVGLITGVVLLAFAFMMGWT
jgi:hypothetical protein